MLEDSYGVCNGNIIGTLDLLTSKSLDNKKHHQHKKNPAWFSNWFVYCPRIVPVKISKQKVFTWTSWTSAILFIFIWMFPKMGLPPVIIHVMFGFSIINHPAIGVLPFKEPMEPPISRMLERICHPSAKKSLGGLWHPLETYTWTIYIYIFEIRWRYMENILEIKHTHIYIYILYNGCCDIYIYIHIWSTFT